MKLTFQILAAVAFVCAFLAPTSAQQLVMQPRADSAETPLMVYAPTDPTCHLLAVISPGAGGTEKGYSYLAKGLRDNGWLAIVVGHKESGPVFLRNDMLKDGIHGGTMKMVTDASLHRDRLMDIGAALKWSSTRCKHPYKALLGHSMGSMTVMFEAGARNKLDVHGQDRFDAYVALSPSGVGSIFPENAWSHIYRPMYILTGTRDKGLEGDWQWRASPYDDLPSGCKWLGIVDGATHMNFAGVGFSKETQQRTLASVITFLNDARVHKCGTLPQSPGITLKGK